MRLFILIKLNIQFATVREDLLELYKMGVNLEFTERMPNSKNI